MIPVNFQVSVVKVAFHDLQSSHTAFYSNLLRELTIVCLIRTFKKVLMNTYCLN